MTVSIVVPTIGRPSLYRLLDSLAGSDGAPASEIVIVDDRPGHPTPLDLDEAPGWTADAVRVVRSHGRGPAAARNVGWRAARADWIAFLDDDVEVTPAWLTMLDRDLDVDDDVAGSQARIAVPLPSHRRPTDWERGTHGLGSARWITADITYRRSVLAEAGGFDERFLRAFREDADLALRVVAAGHRIVDGARQTVHPVRPAPWNASITQQRGNADDALMRRLHGADWYERADAAPGRRPRHLVTTAAAVVAVGAAVRRRRRLSRVAAAAWAVATGEFAWARIAPGPRDRAEVTRMFVTSAAIPVAATWHWLDGLLRHRTAAPWRGTRIQAVLVDRDGTLVRDIPYNGVPQLVDPLPGVDAGLDRLRAAGIPVGVITNQSGVARGLLTRRQVGAVNARVEELLGPFATWQVCLHGEDDRCDCRKPGPGMVIAAARALGVPVGSCAVIGDIGADMQAATSAGAALAVLVPNEMTRREEIDSAPTVYATFAQAVDAILAEVAR